MQKENQIRTLTSHIYGPYYDYVLLKESFPVDGTPLDISELQMFTKHREIGFDETEFIGKPPKGSLGARNEKVVFFGVLTISSLEWLSEQGLDYLERDLREYDQTQHLEHTLSGLTLRTLYGDKTWKGSRLKVMIACDKTLLAHFMTARTYPNQLMMYSVHEGKSRRYRVQSLHVITFSKSRRFFDRYRLRALIKELIETDQDKTPVEKRNIDWLVQRYLASIHPKDADRRIITDPELEPSIYSEPRHLNHLPRARIRHFFAAQAEWLLAHMLASVSKQIKLLNIRHWIRFCHEARLDSIEAKKNGVRWGVSHGSQIDIKGHYNLSRNLAKFGYTPDIWETKLNLVTATKTSKPSRPLSPPPLGDSLPCLETSQFQYDSDFSEPSTPGVSDYEMNEGTNDLKVPEFCMERPFIPHGKMTWTCPGTGCDYQLDLVDMSRVVNNLSQSRSGIQIPNDWDNRTLLLMLISRHYESDHLQKNVGVFQSSSTWRVEPLQVPETDKRAVVAVKREADADDLEPQIRRSNRKHRPRKPFV